MLPDAGVQTGRIYSRVRFSGAVGTRARRRGLIELNIRRLCTRISQRSHVSDPSPSGLFLHGTTSLLVGSGIGPDIATPVFSLIVLICLQTLSTFIGSVPLSEILALCAITTTHHT